MSVFILYKPAQNHAALWFRFILPNTYNRLTFTMSSNKRLCTENFLFVLDFKYNEYRQKFFFFSNGQAYSEHKILFFFFIKIYKLLTLLHRHTHTHTFWIQMVCVVKQIQFQVLLHKYINFFHHHHHQTSLTPISPFDFNWIYESFMCVSVSYMYEIRVKLTYLFITTNQQKIGKRGNINVCLTFFFLCRFACVKWMKR